MFDRTLVSWPWRNFERVHATSARTVKDESGKEYVQVCSTQYLGTLWHDRASAAISTTLQSTPLSYFGSFGSNYLGGTHEERIAFELGVAKACGTEAALAFASGWAACYAVAEMLGKFCDLIISDVRNHNSVIHGLRGSRAKLRRVDLNSNDVTSIVHELRLPKAAIVYPSVEGITGEAVFPSVSATLRSRTLIVVDECHSFGALGETGTFQLGPLSADVRILGLSKAFGTMGAVVCSTREIVDLLSQVASPWIFSTAVPPVIWSINNALLPVVVGMKSERRAILELARQFRALLNAAQLRFSGEHHITGVRLPKRCDGAHFEQTLYKKGFYAKVSQYPSRPENDPCARVAFTPWHTSQDVHLLSEAILSTAIC